MSLGMYFIRRIFSLIPFTIGISVLIFFMFALTPIDPVNSVAGLDPGLQKNRDRIAASWGLDKPIPVRYWNWAYPMFTRLDFGESWTSKGVPVTDKFVPYVGNTAWLFGINFILSLIFATVLGIVASTNHNSVFDQITLFMTLVGFSVPNFVLGLVIQQSVASWSNQKISAIFYTAGGKSLWENWPAIIAAELTMLVGGVAFTTRLVRSQMLNVLRQNYIRTARAKGLTERTVIYGHALRNALLPFVTVIALSLPGILSGSAIIEQVFNFPGVGRSLIRAALAFDMPTVLAVNMFFGTLSIFMLIIADIAYGVVDPRIKF